MKTNVRPRTLLLLTVTSLVIAACVISSTTTRGRLVDKAAMSPGTFVVTPLKVHLIDGGVILFAGGTTIDRTRVSGVGSRYDAARGEPRASDGVPMDSVLGFEVYERTTNTGRTLVYGGASLAASGAASLFGLAALAVVIFGSCPTIYGDSAGVETLQAESFSYSIAPLLAKRDVDRMTVAPDADGVIRLAVRNEALETHHLDQMEIIEVRHANDEIALPSPRGGAIAVSDWETDATVRDASGRDVSPLVVDADDRIFGTADSFLDGAIAGGPVQDQLTITLPRRAGMDSLALMLRARASLLTTTILYEHLMGKQGVLALDWMGQDLSRIATLAQLGTWYGGNFGMRVEVQDGDGWRSIIRLMDWGPTAWRTVGVTIPTTDVDDDSVRIRLTFPADAYRIDQIGVAREVRRADQRVIPIARALDSAGSSREDLVTMLARADQRDVETHPGDQFWIEFDVGQVRGESRTFLFAGQGYYVEWLRPGWMTEDPEPFSPSKTTMRDLLESWRAGRDSLETVFFNRRVPVI